MNPLTMIKQHQTTGQWSGKPPIYEDARKALTPATKMAKKTLSDPELLKLMKSNAHEKRYLDFHRELGLDMPEFHDPKFHLKQAMIKGFVKRAMDYGMAAHDAMHKAQDFFNLHNTKDNLYQLGNEWDDKGLSTQQQYGELAKHMGQHAWGPAAIGAAGGGAIGAVTSKNKGKGFLAGAALGGLAGGAGGAVNDAQHIADNTRGLGVDKWQQHLNNLPKNDTEGQEDSLQHINAFKNTPWYKFFYPEKI